MQKEKVVAVYFGILSPFTYLGMQRLKQICSRHDAKLLYKPTDFFEVFKVSGGVPLEQRSEQRKAYRLLELKRWSAYLGIPLNPMPKYFPVDMTAASLMVIAAQSLGLYEGDLCSAYEEATWVNDQDISDPITLIDIAHKLGFDGQTLYEHSEGESVRAIYDANTVEAIELNMFGSPTYLYRDEIFWGQDRLDLLDWTMSRR